MRKKVLLLFFLPCLAIASFSLLQYKLKVREEEEFAKYLLIREMGIYTLVGSKPISEFHIAKRVASPMDETTKADCPILYVSPAEIEATKENHFNLEEVPSLWNKWQKRHKIRSKKYAFVTISSEEIDWICFVNKALVKKVLVEYYPLFVKQVGFAFDIDSVLANIDDVKALFWQEIFPLTKQKHVAAGLFFGYGLENAIYFEETARGVQQQESVPSVPLIELLKIKWKKHISLKDLPLPIFGVSSNGTKQVEQYQKEREQIRKEYQEKNLRQLLIEAFK